jgi:hypothetical protein
MVFSAAGFARVFPEKRLELKSLKGQTKAEEEGPPGFPGVSQEKLGQNGGTEDAPRGDGPSLKIHAVTRNTYTYRGFKRKGARVLGHNIIFVANRH